jgi:hypothetical protein
MQSGFFTATNIMVTRRLYFLCCKQRSLLHGCFSCSETFRNVETINQIGVKSHDIGDFLIQSW